MEKLRRIEIAATDDLAEVWAMSNVRPKHTGLPMVIWVQAMTGKEKHGPRLKVQLNHGDKAEVGNWVTVTIEDSPEVIGEGLERDDEIIVKKFIKKNKKALLQLWNDQIDPAEFFQLIEKI